MPPAVQRVSESVYCIRRKAYLSCSYLVAFPTHVVFIDAGMDPAGADVRAGLEHVGRPIDDVSAILLTHWHNDHAAGAAWLKERGAVRVYYHRDGAAKFTRATAARGLRGWLARRLPDAGRLAPFRGLLEAACPRALQADTFVEDNDLVEEHFRVLETPGHEAGHVSYYFEPERVLFAGDALAVAGDHVTYISRLLTQDVEAARASMLRCLDLDLHAICPGHRHPLIAPSPVHLAAVREEVSARRRWPVFGA